MKRFQIDTNSQVDLKSLKIQNIINGPASSKSNNKRNEYFQNSFSPKQMTPKQTLSRNDNVSSLFFDKKLNKFAPKVNNDQNILSKELLKLQIREKDYKPSKQIKNISWSSNELANAMQKYHQYLQQKNKQPNNEEQQNQGIRPKKIEEKSKLLNQFITKVNPEDMTNNRINIQFGSKKKMPLSKPLTPTQSEANSQKQVRPSTLDLVQSARLKQSSLPTQNQPLTQSVFVQNNSKKLSGRQFSEAQLITQKKITQKQTSVTPTVLKSENKYFEASRKGSQDQSSQISSQSQGLFIYYLTSLKKSFSKPLKEDYFSRLYRDHFYQTYQGIYFAQFLKPADTMQSKTKKVQLKKKEEFKSCIFDQPKYQLDKITLVFDLDETLVHCNENTNIPSDIILNIQISKNESINLFFNQAGINIRPYAIDILRNLAEEFEIIIFTASHSCYASKVRDNNETLSKVLDHLDPENKLIQYRLYRENCCMTTGGMYIKDLKIFEDRSLDQLVLVDNAAYSYAWQVDNGIPIIPFYDNKEDRELIHLEAYLKQMIGTKDVRNFNKNNLKLSSFNDPCGPQKVFENLFGCTMNQ